MKKSTKIVIAAVALAPIAWCFALLGLGHVDEAMKSAEVIVAIVVGVPLALVFLIGSSDSVPTPAKQRPKARRRKSPLPRRGAK